MRFQCARLPGVFTVVVLAAMGLIHSGHQIAMADRVVTVEVQFNRETGVVSFPGGGNVVMRGSGTISFVLASVGAGGGNAVITGITFPDAPMDPATEFAPRNGDSFGARRSDGGLALTDHCRRAATFNYCLHVAYLGNLYSSDPQVINEPTT